MLRLAGSGQQAAALPLSAPQAFLRIGHTAGPLHGLQTVITVSSCLCPESFVNGEACAAASAELGCFRQVLTLDGKPLSI